MPNLLVRDVPQHVVESLKTRAASHRRSLQQEMVEILERATEGPTPREAADMARDIRERLIQAGVDFDDSVQLIRADRER